MSLNKKVQDFSKRHSLFEKGEKIIIGVSGGPDSVCLFNILLELKKIYNLELIIAHVNYGLRGQDSKKDEELVKKMAKKACVKLKISRPKILNKKNLEEKLREIRYQYFEKLREKENFDLIAIAHNRDDQVETFLMRLIRGSGLLGLRSMLIKNGKIVRPLLETPREEIEKYLKKKKIPFRIDKTNLGTDFERNKIRNLLIPYLKKNFNPNIEQTILKNLSSISQDVDFLEIQTPEVSKRHTLSAKKILSLHPAIQKRILREFIRKEKGDLKGISASHIEEFLKIIKSSKGKNQIMRLKKLKIEKKGDKITIV